MARKTKPQTQVRVERAERLLLDSGAVIAIARRDERARAFLRRALELDADVVVPVAVLAETLRGGPKDAPVHQVLSAIGVPTPTTAAIGRLAGELLGRTSGKNTVDALVIAEAVAYGGANVLTSDPADLGRLAQNHSNVVIRAL